VGRIHLTVTPVTPKTLSYSQTTQCNQTQNVPELSWNTIIVIVLKVNMSLFLCKWGLF